MYVTEDTTRADPETLRALYSAAIECGAKRVCICDTVGHSLPEGVERLVRHVCGIVAQTGESVGVDWHGHRDRGLAVVNTLAAIRAGATRVHGCGLGVGERAGNTPIDLVLVNLKLLGWIDRDLTRLREYCEAVAKALKVAIPRNYPVVGSDAFETGTGVHAAAVIKAFRKGDVWLADRVYSGVPAGDFGLKQRIRIGPMSGKSNVIYWLEEHGMPAGNDLVERIFAAAKSSDRLLEDDEILALAGDEAAR
jgi:2-isopropylmalate synthase